MLLWAAAASLGWGRGVKQAKSFSWAVPKSHKLILIPRAASEGGWIWGPKAGIGDGLGERNPGNTQKPPKILWFLQESKANPFSFNKFQLQTSQLEFGLSREPFGNERNLLGNFSPTFCSPRNIKDCHPQMQKGKCWRVGFLALVHPFAPCIAAGRCRVLQQAKCWNAEEYWIVPRRCTKLNAAKQKS